LVNPEYLGIFITMLPSAPIGFRSLRLVGLLICCLPQLLSAQASTQKFISTYRPLADSLSAVYGIPAAVILGVSMLESGAGTSRNARLLKNYFGIVGRNSLLKTHGIRTRYKQYTSDSDSFIDFCRLLTRKKFYASLKGNPQPQLWIKSIAASGYSEAPVLWQQRVLSTIRKNRL